jgi:hypothetical protein
MVSLSTGNLEGVHMEMFIWYDWRHYVSFSTFTNNFLQLDKAFPYACELTLALHIYIEHHIIHSNINFVYSFVVYVRISIGLWGKVGIRCCSQKLYTKPLYKNTEDHEVAPMVSVGYVLGYTRN